MGLRRRAANLLLKSLGFGLGGDTASGAGGAGGSGFFGPWPLLLPSTRINYAVEAGDLLDNSAVMACLQWICRTFPEAPVQVRRRTKAGSEVVPDHRLTRLLRFPNAYYNGLLLWQATLISWNTDGNAYWLINRSAGGKPAELWYEPHYSCRPTWPEDGSEFISGYQVLRRGQWKTVPEGRKNVIHFRNGIDPRNPRQGLAPLASALKEVFTDNEAASFTAALLRNMGIPGLVLSPADSDAQIDNPEGLKKEIMTRFGGDRRGEPLVMQGPTKVEMLGFSPAALNLEAVRNIPEERVSALLGIPAIVAGLGAGYDHATYANYQQSREAAYQNNLLPTQRLLSAQLDTSLLPDLGDETTEQVEFDTSKVQALADDQTALYARLSQGYRAGWIKRAEARTRVGLEATPADDLFYTDIMPRTERLTENEPAGTLLALDAAQAAADAAGKE
jgi:HK97 family phage portal protein